MVDANVIAVAVRTAIDSILGVESKKRIPVFSGSSKESFLKWIKEAESVANQNNWQPLDRLKFFSERLEGAAEQFNKNELWPQNTPEADKTYPAWKQRMKNRFVTPIDEERLRHKFENLKQDSEESVGDFVSRINDLFLEAYGEEYNTSVNPIVQKKRNEIKERVLSLGLLPMYRIEFWKRLPDTTQSFENLSKIALVAEQMVHRREMWESSSLFAIIDKHKADCEETTENHKMLNDIEKDPFELKSMTTAHIEAVTTTDGGWKEYKQPLKALEQIDDYFAC